MGLWEGFTSIIGYALMLAVNIPFFPHFEGKKKLLLTVTLFFKGYTWSFMVIILGIVVFETLFEGLNGITPRLGGYAINNASDH